MDQIGQKAPVFSKPLQKQMQGAAEQMGQAQESLAQRDPNGAASHAGDAASQLERFQQALQKSMQGGGGQGGGMSLPMPMPDGESDGQDEGGEGSTRPPEDVELKDAERNEGGEAYRKDIMNAMKQGAPARYKEQVKKYYEEIVK